MKLGQLVRLENREESQLSVISCKKCKLVLGIFPVRVDIETLFARSKKCPDCGSELDSLILENTACLGTVGRLPYFDPRLDPSPLSTQELMIDQYFLDPIRESPRSQEDFQNSRLTLLHGRRKALIQGHYECARDALKGRVIILDGGNSFNASYLEESIETTDRNRLLENIFISRAFNYHQMTSLVTEKLSEILPSCHPITIGVFEPTFLYEDADVIDEQDAWYSFKQLVWTLRRLSGRTMVRILIVVSNLKTEAGMMLEDVCVDRVDCDRETLSILSSQF